MEIDYKELFRKLTSRYRGADPQALIQVLCPMLVPIHRLDKEMFKVPGENHYRATFWVVIDESNQELVIRGRTGKFVPKEYTRGGIWREIAKGRIIEVDPEESLATGEVYTGGTKKQLVEALDELSEDDYLEIDQYGAAAKVLSGLVEYSFARIVRESGYKVTRMPEDMAKHLGTYYHYDFELERDDAIKRVEVKSLWGTNTKYARLIHSKTKEYLTSSCKFETQDIFAVNLFLRTGDIRDFAFARSVPIDVKPYGLPRSSKYPEYVHQNPPCEIGDGTWFASIDEVWDLE
jgi:hypothetical protein